jgi:hypothetical protein
LGSFSLLAHLASWHFGAEKILKSEDFCLGARCAPERAKAQRAAPFGRLGRVWLRFDRSLVSRQLRPYPQDRTAIAAGRASASAAIRDCEHG